MKGINFKKSMIYLVKVNYTSYMIRSRIQGMYWCAHKTATLTSFQRTVGGGRNCPLGPPRPRLFRRSLVSELVIQLAKRKEAKGASET